MAWPANAQPIGGMAVSPDGALYVTLGGAGPIGSGITGAQAGAQSIQAPFALLLNGIPFISVSSGSMGNNGALSGITALDVTYSDGCWMLFPAGAIAAGVPAASTWYWTVMSSGTAGTVFNSTYASGQVTPGTATAFATTGPGAFTGSTSDDAAITVSLPANSLGTQGQLLFDLDNDASNTANAKTIKLKYGGTTFAAFPALSGLSGHWAGKIANRGAANRQIGSTQAAIGGWGVAGAINTFRGTVDSTTAQNVVISLTKATATDNLILSDATIQVIYRP